MYAFEAVAVFIVIRLLVANVLQSLYRLLKITNEKANDHNRIHTQTTCLKIISNLLLLLPVIPSLPVHLPVCTYMCACFVRVCVFVFV